MPFYNCILRKGLVDDDEKQRLAQGITDIHCRYTGAPRYFVHVLFTYFDAEDIFSAGSKSEFSFIRAGHRAGRSSELKLKIMNELSDLWYEVVKKAKPEHLMITFTETGPGNVMEGGLVLPEPKDDETWMRENGIL